MRTLSDGLLFSTWIGKSGQRRRDEAFFQNHIVSCLRRRLSCPETDGGDTELGADKRASVCSGSDGPTTDPYRAFIIRSESAIVMIIVIRIPRRSNKVEGNLLPKKPAGFFVGKQSLLPCIPSLSGDSYKHPPCPGCLPPRFLAVLDRVAAHVHSTQLRCGAGNAERGAGDLGSSTVEQTIALTLSYEETPTRGEPFKDLNTQTAQGQLSCLGSAAGLSGLRRMAKPSLQQSPCSVVFPRSLPRSIPSI